MERFALYPALLGDAWETLPVPVKSCFDATPTLVASGRFSVRHARSPLAWIAIAMSGLPPAGEDVALRLEVNAREHRQLWTRNFGGFSMTTWQWMLADGRLVESTGPLELLFRVAVEDGAVVYRPDGLRLRLGPLAIPIPRWAGPRVMARTWREGNAMRVEVAIAVPLLGTIVTYGGLLSPS